MNPVEVEDLLATRKQNYDHTRHYDTSTVTGLETEKDKDGDPWKIIRIKHPRVPNNNKFSIYETETGTQYTPKQAVPVATYRKPHNKIPERKNKQELPPPKGDDIRIPWNTTTHTAFVPPDWEPNIAKNHNDNAKKIDDATRDYMLKSMENPIPKNPLNWTTTNRDLMPRKRPNIKDPSIVYKDEQLRGKNCVGQPEPPKKNTSTIVRKEDIMKPKYTPLPGLYGTTTHWFHYKQHDPTYVEKVTKDYDTLRKEMKNQEGIASRKRDGINENQETMTSTQYMDTKEAITDEARDFTDPKFRRPQVFKIGIHTERKQDYFHKPGIGAVKMGTTIKIDEELDQDS